MEFPSVKQTKNWTYNEAKALIAVYSSRKEEYFRTKNKKYFWNNVLTDLEALDVLVSRTTAEQVEVKWRTLYRAYKNAKDRGTGSTSSKFMYMAEMDEIYKDNPIISATHTVSLGVQPGVPAASNTQSSESETPLKKQGKIRKANNRMDIKSKFYVGLLEEKRKKREFLEEYLKNKENAKAERHRELMDYLKNKK